MASIVASDLVLYHAATQSVSDVGTVGGAIDTLRRPDFTQVTAGDTVEVVSSSGSDTSQTLTVVGRKADGTLVSETKTLTGTTAAVFSVNGAVDRILSAELSATCAGTVTVRKNSAGATYRVIPIGERGFSMFLQKLSSQAGTSTFYAKLFWKNTNATNALLGANVTESADPSGLITHGLATSVGDSGTATTRQTAPASVTFAGTAANVPGTDLAASTACGLWLLLSLGAAQAAQKTTYTSQLQGSTT